MEHGLFKPQSFDEGRHGVVGDCNGIPMERRYKEETPMFASKILEVMDGARILDYGCGVGRISKEILAQADRQGKRISVVGVDPSPEMRDLAIKNVNHANFMAVSPEQLFSEVCGEDYFDAVVLVYVLQHIPAIEIREALQRIHYHMRPTGKLFYCSSDYRMAIRFDQPGFFDDRFLGVNLIDEVRRLFKYELPMFTDEELERNPVVKKMITGDLPHPAVIFSRKQFDEGFPLFNAAVKQTPCVAERETSPAVQADPHKVGQKKLILVQKQSPGDIMMATIALRDLHSQYPGEYITDVRTPCNDIFKNSPYVTPINPAHDEDAVIDQLKSDPNHPPIARSFDFGKDEVTYCNLHYPMIHESGARGTHFADSMTEFLAKQLDRPIKRTGLRPEIYLDQNEQLWPSPVVSKLGYEGKYWIINAGSKSDFPLKQYPYYQKVVDLLKDTITFVQVGHGSHNHNPLDGVINMINQTDVRELFRTIHHAQGVLTCVAFPLHIAAALKKPCVCVAGGREGTRWELYPDHRFLYVNGTMDCCIYDGCWKSRIEECAHVEETGNPLCMDMITPEQVADAVMAYYKGGVLCL